MSKDHIQVWGGHLQAPPNELMVQFTAGRDVAALPMADAVLLPYDLWTNRAHAIMLARQGIIGADVLERLLEGLAALEAEADAGRFALDPALEDVHVNVERFLSDRHGPEVGGRLHTGRSRNDQVTCDMRLYQRDAVLALADALRALITTLLEAAGAHTHTVMPGFTHHQPGMMTTWAHWLSGYVQALLRDLERMGNVYTLLNRSPLGGAAGFGTSWPIDRELTAGLLAFDRVERNSVDTMTARGEMEAELAFAMSQMMNHIGLMAQDLILLSHPFWGMVTLDDAYVTGSSIMPQKRNPDLCEVIKGKTSWLHGQVGGLLGMGKGVMSGFNRDSQWSKYMVMDVLRECLPAPRIMQGVFSSLTVHEEVMRARLNEGFLAAADFADVLARTLGQPFRACYNIAADAVGRSGDAGVITPEAARAAVEAAGLDPAAAEDVLQGLADPLEIVRWRNHTGAPAPEAVARSLAEQGAEADQLAAFIAPAHQAIAAARARCINGG